MPPKRYFDALPENPERVVPTSRGAGQLEGSTEAPAAKRVKPNTEPDQSLTTLHVTHLSPSVTTPALAAHFSSCGELKSCFVVCEKNNGPSRGFGYVAYTEVQQAEEAIKKLNGTTLEGSQISVGWAKRRQREGEQNDKKTERNAKDLDREMAERSKAARKAQAQAQAAASGQEDARLIICVRGLDQPLLEGDNQEEARESPDSLKKALYKKVKKMAYGLDKAVAEDALLQVKYPLEDGLGAYKSSHVLCITLMRHCSTHYLSFPAYRHTAQHQIARSHLQEPTPHNLPTRFS